MLIFVLCLTVLSEFVVCAQVGQNISSRLCIKHNKKRKDSFEKPAPKKRKISVNSDVNFGVLQLESKCESEGEATSMRRSYIHAKEELSRA